MTAHRPDVVRRGVELEVDEVESAGQSDPKAPVSSPDDAPGEVGWEARSPLTGDGGVEPVRRQTEVSRDGRDGVAQLWRKRIGRPDIGRRPHGVWGRQRNDIDIVGRPTDDSQEVERSSADDDDGKRVPAAPEQGAGGLDR